MRDVDHLLLDKGIAHLFGAFFALSRLGAVLFFPWMSDRAPVCAAHDERYEVIAGHRLPSQRPAGSWRSWTGDLFKIAQCGQIRPLRFKPDQYPPAAVVVAG
jgi:hypothetical protein